MADQVQRIRVLAWHVEAAARTDSSAIRELCGMLAMRFGGIDVDKDGKLSVAEFNGSCKDIASLIRRSGLAPGWLEEYDTTERRTASHKALSGMPVFRRGPPR